MMNCYLRVFVDGTESAANDAGRHIAERFDVVALRMQVLPAKSYYKVEGWQVVALSFTFDETQTDFGELLAVLSSGWERLSERFAVWNSQVLLGGSPRAPFVESAVTWASMELDEVTRGAVDTLH